MPTQDSTPSSTGQKIKIGASVAGASVFVFVFFVVTLVVYRKRKRPQPQEVIPERKKSEDSEFTGKPELSGESELRELDHDPECLLLHQLQRIRCYEMRAPIPSELDGSLCRCEMDATVRYELPGFREVKELESGFEKETGFDKDNETKKDKESNEPSQAKEAAEKKEESESNAAPQPKEAGEKKNVQQELPIWGWAVLKREKLEQEEREREQRAQDLATARKEKRKEDDEGVIPLSPETSQRKIDEQEFSKWRESNKENIHVPPLRISKISGEDSPSDSSSEDYYSVSPLRVSKCGTPNGESKVSSLHTSTSEPQMREIPPLRIPRYDNPKEGDLVSPLYPSWVRDLRRRSTDIVSPV